MVGNFQTWESQHSGKGIPLFMTGHKICLEAEYHNGRRILCSQNSICIANVSDQSARKYEENFSTETEDQSCLYPILKSTNTVSSQVFIAGCKCLFRNLSAVIFYLLLSFINYKYLR